MAALSSNVHSATERDAVATYFNGHTQQQKRTKCHWPRYTSITQCTVLPLLHEFTRSLQKCEIQVSLSLHML